MRDLHVVVVGGALGGATAALLLARAGARVTVLEKVAEPRAVGAGIGIAENGLAVLEALGLGAELARLGTEVGAIRVVDGRGRSLLVPRVRAPRLLMLRRGDLQGALLAAVAAQPRVQLRLDAEVLRADPEGAVVLRTPGGEETLRADLVVGADGVHSRVREGADFGAVVRRTGVRYVRMLVPAGLARGEEAWTSQGLFGSVAVPDGTYAYVSAQGPAAHLLESGELARWKEEWARAYPASADVMASIASRDQLLVNEVIRVDCRRYFSGKLVLLGDAAHAMAPNLGQGGNSAVVDAAVLAASLRDADDLSAALERYDARRRPAVRKVADTAERLGALAHWTNRFAVFLRAKVLMPLAERLGDEKAMATVLQESSKDLAELCAFGRSSQEVPR